MTSPMDDEQTPAKPYRFLLRMPESLRESLLEASQRSESSLNTEIVRRLERSVAGEHRAHARFARSLRRRPAALALASAGATIALGLAVVGATTNGSSAQHDEALLGSKLAQTSALVQSP